MVMWHPREVHHAHPISIAAIKSKGLKETYEKLVRAKKECTKKLEEVVLNHDLTEGKVKDGSALSKDVDKASEAQVKAKSVVVHIANQIFQLYSNFFLEETRQPWSKILAERLRMFLMSVIQMSYELLQVPWGRQIVFVGVVCDVLM